MTKLSELIGFDKQTAQFVLGTHNLKGEASNHLQASELPELSKEVAALLAGIRATGEHEALAAAMVDPIEQVVPYVEQFGVFFQETNYGVLEDNSIPVENIPTIAWQTHPEGAVLYARAGYSFTRPDFVTFDTGIEVPWATLEKAGWNFLSRQMSRAMQDLARKRDNVARVVLEAATPVGSNYSVATTMTKASVDTIMRAKAAIGFPVSQILINPSRMMDMSNAAGWTWGNGFFMPPDAAKNILTTLHLGYYGGANWYTNPNANVNKVYFGGQPAQIGWHQTRGSVKSASDIDITNKLDKHVMLDQEHAWFVGNTWTLATLDIT